VAQLAAPRGVELVDEMTGKSATLQRTVCGITYYYSTRESADLDWSVVERVGQLLADLATEKGAQGTREERAVHKERARSLTAELAKVTGEMASQRLIARDYEHAVPAALRCLRALTSLHGTSSALLVPAYLLLGEANLRLGRTAQAEEFLSMSSYVLSKVSEEGGGGAGSSATKGGGQEGDGGEGGGSASAHGHGQGQGQGQSLDEVKSRLHRNFGKLYMAQGNPSAAAEAFAKDIFHASLAAGPESVAASGGYFQLGKALAATGKQDAALACYDKIVQIWHMRLTNTRSAISKAVAALAAGAENGDGGAGAGAGAAVSASSPPGPPLGPVEIAEGLDILEDIRATRASALGASHVSVAEAAYTSALLLLLGGGGGVGTGNGTGTGVGLAAATTTRAASLLDTAIAIFTKEKVRFVCRLTSPFNDFFFLLGPLKRPNPLPSFAQPPHFPPFRSPWTSAGT
jgi:tetratricopeptide (TPR) repeat protein